MEDATEIATKNTIPTLPPLPGVTPPVHAPSKGDGKNWPLANAGIAVVAWRPQLCSPEDTSLEQQQGGVG